MKHFIYRIFTALLFIGFSFFIATEALSQTDRQENKIDTTGGVTAAQDEYSPVTGITTGRAYSIAASVIGLISVISGWRAKRLSARGTGSVRTIAIAALALGITGIVLSLVHLSISAGAVFGSGSGKAGTIVALMLGLIGAALGGLALRQKKV